MQIDIARFYGDDHVPTLFCLQFARQEGILKRVEQAAQVRDQWIFFQAKI